MPSEAWVGAGRSPATASPCAHRIAASERKSQPICDFRVYEMKNLNLKAWRGLMILPIVMGLSLFVSAGTMRYWQAWGYLAVYFGASLLITRYLMKKDPALLQRRWSGGPTAEKEKPQRIIMRFVLIGFIALLVVPALDYRFGWSAVPPYAVIAGDILVAVGFFIDFPRVSREHLHFSDHRSRGRSEGHLYRALCVGTPPDVRRSFTLSFWHAAGAWLLLGISGARGNNAIFHMATL